MIGISLANIPATPTTVNTWGTKDDSWSVLKGQNAYYHLHVPSLRLFEPSSSIKEFVKGALFTCAAPYFFGAQAVAHAVEGALQIKESKREEGKKLLMQAGIELAASLILGSGYYSWVPNCLFIGYLAYNPLGFRVALNSFEDYLIGTKRSANHSAETNQLGWKDVWPAIANNSLRLSDLCGMGQVVYDVNVIEKPKGKDE